MFDTTSGGKVAVVADSATPVFLSKNCGVAENSSGGKVAEITPAKMLAQGPLRWGLLCCLRPDGLAAQRASDANFWVGNDEGVQCPTQSPFPRARIQPAAISECLDRSVAFPASPHRRTPRPRQRASCRVLEGGEKCPSNGTTDYAPP
jgi:hypothetical protein